MYAVLCYNIAPFFLYLNAENSQKHILFCRKFIVPENGFLRSVVFDQKGDQKTFSGGGGDAAAAVFQKQFARLIEFIAVKQKTDSGFTLRPGQELFRNRPADHDPCQQDRQEKQKNLFLFSLY